MKNPSYPTSHDELLAADWTFDNVGLCRACSRRIHWYRTPDGKARPLEKLDSTRLQPHHWSCEYAREFRGSKKAEAEKPDNQLALTF